MNQEVTAEHVSNLSIEALKNIIGPFMAKEAKGFFIQQNAEVPHIQNISDRQLAGMKEYQDYVVRIACRFFSRVSIP